MFAPMRPSDTSNGFTLHPGRKILAVHIREGPLRALVVGLIALAVA